MWLDPDVVYVGDPVVEAACLVLLSITTPEPPFPALSLPELVKPAAPPPPVFVLPLLLTENG
jgi:hypothetical protein